MQIKSRKNVLQDKDRKFHISPNVACAGSEKQNLRWPFTPFKKLAHLQELPFVNELDKILSNLFFYTFTQQKKANFQK